MARAAPDKRSKLQRERERDISEQIALGMPTKSKVSNETQFDQRLFGQAQGLSQGYGDDEAYNVYDKPWRDGGSMANHIYRPSKNIDKDNYGGEELEKAIRTNRYVDIHLFLINYNFLLLGSFPIKNLVVLIAQRVAVDLDQCSLKKILLDWINSCLRRRNLVNGKSQKEEMTGTKEREEINFFIFLVISKFLSSLLR